MSEKAVVLTETATALSSKLTIGGGFGSFGAFLMGFNWIGWLSLAIAFCGLIVTTITSYKKNKREQVEHELRKKESELRIRALEGQCNVKDK